MRILHDLTYRIEPGMLLYPGDSAPSVRRLSTIGAAGASYTASELTLGCHVGTHVDAPGHFLAGGASVEQLAVEHFYGPAIVVEPAAAGGLMRDRHILIKTNEAVYGGLTIDLVETLLAAAPLSIGCDAYCLDAPSTGVCAIAVAARGLPAFVRLDLRGVNPGPYWFSALPLPVKGVEGIPVRAVLWEPAFY